MQHDSANRAELTPTDEGTSASGASDGSLSFEHMVSDQVKSCREIYSRELRKSSSPVSDAGS